MPAPAPTYPGFTPASGPAAAIAVIGDEILSGKVVDENARFLLAELRALGVEVRRIEVLPDREDVIAERVRALAAAHDHVFTSGGIGPTHDDVTLASVAAAFAMRLARRPELERFIRDAAGAALHERDLRMADVPEGATLLYGTPPDPARWPVVAVRNAYLLPGVPSIFRRKFAGIREMFRAAPIHSLALLSRAGEGHIAGALDEVVAAFPGVAVGSYPQMDAPDHRVRVTLDGRDPGALERAASRLVERLGPDVVRRAPR